MKENIQHAILQFNQLSIFDATVSLLKVLGYESPKVQKAQLADYIELFNEHETANIEKAKVKTDWKSADFIFQITKDEIIKQHDLFTDVRKADNINIDSYFVVAIELTEKNYTRTDLADISREVNKLHGLPTLIFFTYNNFLTISITYRRDNKKDSDKEVLGKVTLIKDIDISQPKRSHIEILFDLSFNELKSKFTISNWVELHDAWQKTLDTKTLNNRFYKEIANWYFWAVENVEFPKDAEKDKVTGKDTISVIRMLTRIVFCWFMKEKEELIPEKLFIKSEIEKLLNDLSDSESTYYKAILQNLFFATLNTEIKKREFRSEKKGKKGSNPDYGKHYVYRYRSLFKNEVDFENLFNNIPYLNGGIFDCLDIKGFGIPDKELKYIDGFSERGADYQAKVPNVLFFGERKRDTEYGMDLCHIYETPKKKYELEGLVNILNSYKFTISENTPLEQEIALDPELLGKVFESLLAYYNPETGQNARKQQGSYYTPVEIVEYMVDESLKQYLKNATLQSLSGFEPNSDLNLDTKIETLVSFQNFENPFNKEETLFLVNAILKIKICDPACGSGAFPIGILNKLVFILKKLDDDGEIIKQKLIDLKEDKKIKIKETNAKLHILKTDIEHAKKIVSDKPREIAIKELEKEIENLNLEVKILNKDIENQPNFLRKLYLIKNCIYGVDIQSIAVTISKLRFFLSLLVDTTVHHDKDNKGIEPLPNLDYKLMQGNSLLESFEDIDLSVEVVNNELFDDNKVSSFSDKDINKLLELINVYFYTSDHNQKEEINKTIRKIITDFLHFMIDLKISIIEKKLKGTQSTIFNYQKSLNAEILEGNKRKYQKVIQQAAKELKIYENELSRKQNQKIKIDEVMHQNENQLWFLWHLYFKDVFNNGGFDIVIGNPPYGANLEKKTRDYIVSFLGKVPDFEIYYFFIEIAKMALKKNGAICYIIPNTFMFNVFASDYRKKMIDYWNFNKILDCTNFKIFESATVNNAIIILEKDSRNNLVGFKNTNGVTNFSELLNKDNQYITKNDLILNNQNWALLFKVDKKVINLIIRIKSKCKSLEFYFPEISQGLIAYDKYRGQDESTIKNRIYHFSHYAKEGLKKFLWGEDVSKYKIQWNEKEYIDYCSGIANPRQPKFFKGTRLLVREITNPSIFCGYAEEELYHDPAIIVILDNNTYQIKILLGILNSKLSSFLHFNSSPKATKGTFPKILVEDIKNFPIPEISKNTQTPFIHLVDYILFLKKQELKTPQERLMPAYFEQMIDVMVYELYFEELLKQHQHDILKYLTDLPDITEIEDDKKKLNIIEEQFNRFYDLKNPVRNSLYYIKNIDEIAIIEEGR